MVLRKKRVGNPGGTLLSVSTEVRLGLPQAFHSSRGSHEKNTHHTLHTSLSACQPTQGSALGLLLQPTRGSARGLLFRLLQVEFQLRADWDMEFSSMGVDRQGK